MEDARAFERVRERQTPELRGRHVTEELSGCHPRAIGEKRAVLETGCHSPDSVERPLKVGCAQAPLADTFRRRILH